MRRTLYVCVGVVLASVLAATPLISSQQDKQPAKGPTDKGPAHSKLYRGFDPGALVKTCKPYYDRAWGNGARSGLQFGRTPDWFKLFDIEGNISEDKLKKLLAELKTDLHKMAKASGVEKVSQPDDSIEDRPISVLRAMYFGRKIRPGSLHGFYLTYSDGKITGAIDVFAALSSDPIDDYWEVVCAVHEVVPE